MRPLIFLPALCALAACADDAPDNPRAISSSEAQALDEAAQMIEQRRVPADAIGSPTSEPQQAEPPKDDNQP